MGLGAVIGLDIGNTTIKAVEVRGGKGGAHVTALGIVPTPLDSINQNMVIDAAALGSAIKELLTSCGARARHVVSSVAGQQALVVRIIEVPRMTEKELADTMKWEVERHVPFASSELQMDYQIIDRPDLPPDSQQMEVLLVVAQQEMVNAHLEAIQGAGLEPAAIDVEPLASARALVDVHREQMAGKTVAMVNIGAQSTDISVVRDGYLLFQRTIATAGDALTQAIATSLNVSTEEAERIKRTYGTVDLEAFNQNDVSAEDVFGGGSGFDFGVPEADADAAPAEEPTVFNPFAAAEEETPAAPEPETPLLPIFGQSEPEEATQANPFAAAEEEAPALDAANPFAAVEETPAIETANPFAAAEQETPELEVANPFAAAEETAEAEVANPFAAGAEETPEATSAFAAVSEEGTGEEEASPFGLTSFGTEAAGGFGAAGAGGSADEELTPQRVFAIIREPLSDLVTEIQRSVEYFRGRGGDATIDSVLLSGGTARLPRIEELLASELGLPVDIADPFQAVPVQSSRYPAEYVRQIAPMFTVSVGLGLRETVF